MKNTEHANFHPTALAAVNEALVVLGQDVVLTELRVDSNVAHSRKAAYLFEGSRIRVLRDHAWTFARREDRVCQCAPCHCRDGGAFRFAFPKPVRCARVVACFDAAGRMLQHRLFADAVETDRPAATVTYVYDEPNLDRWSPDAYRALVLRLAADLAKPITGRINERQLQEQAYAEQLANAKLNDARETNVEYDAYGSNHVVDAMRGGVNHARRDPFRRT